MQKNPTITIITIVYNGEALLEDTIKSVINQTYPNIEYLIIDGASKDNTLSIIKKYESKITKWISEPDKGLYDAMNKGIQLATGDFLWFMNCGDHIYAPDTTQKVVDAMDTDTDILYGEVMLVDEDCKPIGTRSQVTVHQLPKTLTWKSMAHGMVVSHQAFLPKRSIAPLYIEGNLTADIEWVIQCLKKSKHPTPTNIILANYLMGGISKQHFQSSISGRYKVLQKHFGFLPNLLNHGYIVVRGVWQKMTGRAKY